MSYKPDEAAFLIIEHLKAIEHSFEDCPAKQAVNNLRLDLQAVTGTREKTLKRHQLDRELDYTTIN